MLHRLMKRFMISRERHKALTSYLKTGNMSAEMCKKWLNQWCLQNIQMTCGYCKMSVEDLKSWSVWKAREKSHHMTVLWVLLWDFDGDCLDLRVLLKSILPTEKRQTNKQKTWLLMEKVPNYQPSSSVVIDTVSIWRYSLRDCTTVSLTAPSHSQTSWSHQTDIEHSWHCSSSPWEKKQL